MTKHNVATSRDEWNAARVALLEKEKAYSRQGDELAAERRALPWLRVEADYEFDTPDGKKTLAQLFDGKRQLIVYHYMFGPDWELPCKSCTFWSDHFAASMPHLAARDVKLVAVARAPLAKLEAFKARMGWTHEFVSSHDSRFNFDFGVSFTGEEEAPTYNYAPKKGDGTDLPGISCFYTDDEGTIWHTYSTFGRGLDIVNGTYRFLDIAPKGRDEADLPYAQAWVNFKDEYDA